MNNHSFSSYGEPSISISNSCPTSQQHPPQMMAEGASANVRRLQPAPSLDGSALSASALSMSASGNAPSPAEVQALHAHQHHLRVLHAQASASDAPSLPLMSAAAGAAAVCSSSSTSRATAPPGVSTSTRPPLGAAHGTRGPAAAPPTAQQPPHPAQQPPHPAQQHLQPPLHAHTSNHNNNHNNNNTANSNNAANGSHKPRSNREAVDALLDFAKAPVDVFALLCEHNSAHMSADDAERLTPFHCVSAPGITIQSYAARIVKHVETGPDGIMLGLRLIGRYCRRTKMLPSRLCAHRLLLTATVLAVKTHYDKFRSNRTAARVGGLELRELNELEWALYRGVGFQTVVHECELETMLAYSQAVVDSMSSAANQALPYAIANEGFGIARHRQLPTASWMSSHDVAQRSRLMMMQQHNDDTTDAASSGPTAGARRYGAHGATVIPDDSKSVSTGTTYHMPSFAGSSPAGLGP